MGGRRRRRGRRRSRSGYRTVGAARQQGGTEDDDETQDAMGRGQASLDEEHGGRAWPGASTAGAHHSPTDSSPYNRLGAARCRQPVTEVVDDVAVLQVAPATTGNAELVTDGVRKAASLPPHD